MKDLAISILKTAAVVIGTILVVRFVASMSIPVVSDLAKKVA